MPFDKNKNNRRKTDDIRSMADAVEDMRSFSQEINEDTQDETEDTDTRKSRREIRSMSEAVSDVRSFAAGDEDTEETDDPHGDRPPAKKHARVYGAEDEHTRKRSKKRRKKKKKFSISGFLSGSDKKIRRNADQPFTVFGYRVTFWPVFLGLFVVLMLLAFLLNSTNLTVDEQPVTLMALSPDAEGYKILALSDLNGKRFGDKQATLLRQLESLDYDILVCLGDMVGEDGDPEPFYELLDGLPSSKKVYFICGDSDPGPYAPAVRDESAPLADLVLADWILGAIERGATYVDRPVSIDLGSVSLWLTPADMLNVNASESVALWKDQTAQEESGYLAGIAADKNSLPFTNYRYKLAEAHFNAATEMTESDIHISLAHVPPSDSFIESACNQSLLDGKFLTAPDIILAGHYCGGVWNVPLLGAFYVPDSSLPRYGWFPDSQVVSGLREIDDAQMYVTRGLASSGDTPLMPFRLLNAPEISLITITATSPQSMLE